MNRTKQKVYTVIGLLVDAALIAAAYALSYWIQFYVQDNLTPLSAGAYFRYLWFIIPVFLLSYGLFGLYRPMTVTGRLREAFQIIKANIAGLLVLLAFLFVISTGGGSAGGMALPPMTQEAASGQNADMLLTARSVIAFSRMLALRFGVLSVVLTIGWRNAVRLILLYMRKSRFNRKNVLVVGFGRAAQGYIDRVNSHKQWGLDVVGILDDNRSVGDSYRDVKILDGTAALSKRLEENDIQEIVITLGLSEYHKLGDIVKTCEKSGVHTVFIPDYNNIIPTRPYTEDLLGLPVIHIRHVPLMEGGNMMIKRFFDIIGSLAAIVLFSPVMAVTAVLIKLTSPGSLIFRQERIGLHNKPFQMYKFRSMTVQPPDEEADKWTTKGDSRVTGIGKIIRKTSIDELPQLFNVLKGDMSLVGPRPERPFFVEKVREEIPRYMVKHQVRPGMTGWAQVNGYRGDTSIPKRIEYDLYYIENWTLMFDVRILFLTVFRGFVNKNAY